MSDDAELTPYGTISLGGLIALLERRERDQSVYFDFCSTVPTTVDSYRGYYDHLALDWAESGHETVAGLLDTLRNAAGRTFEGYKGGSFRMELDSPIWVSSYGQSSGTAILGLHECDYTAVLVTGYAR